MPLEPGLWEVHDSVANKQMLMLSEKRRKEYGGVYLEGQVQEMEMRCLFGGLGKFTMGAHGPTHPESFVIPLSSTKPAPNFRFSICCVVFPLPSTSSICQPDWTILHP